MPRFIVVSSPSGGSCAIDAEKAVQLSDRLRALVTSGVFSVSVPDFSAVFGELIVKYTAGEMDETSVASACEKMRPVDTAACVSAAIALGFDTLAKRLVKIILPVFPPVPT